MILPWNEFYRNVKENENIIEILQGKVKLIKQTGIFLNTHLSQATCLLKKFMALSILKLEKSL